MVIVGAVHSSVAAVTGGTSPPNAKADVLLAPVPYDFALPVPKSATSVQLVPFQLSVNAFVGEGDSAPKAKALVLSVPAPDKAFLPEFKSFTSVQLVPFHNSVFAIVFGLPP